MASPSCPSDEPRPPAHASLLKFWLYETRSSFYVIGRDESRTCWRVLKIDRLHPSELNLLEDTATYTESECSDLLRQIHEGNKSTAGLQFVTTCYGIVGFIRFLGPYYMLLITKRRKIGTICGHTVYAVSKSMTIPLSGASVWSKTSNFRDENRYKKLLSMVDLTKDFYFSYTYPIMRSLQKNLCDNETSHVLYRSMFVWNEFLTHGIRNRLQNTLWTVPLVYGFFKQSTLSISGRKVILTLIARRSRHYAGTRYLKRGVNEEGRVANDVETEQIVSDDILEGVPIQISSVVQNRGSIPLFWSQDPSRLNLRPDVILSKKDRYYQATRLHFENLVGRYGNPIIILNLIKTHEKKPRESILRSAFYHAIHFINQDLSEENRLRFLHLDLHKHFQSKTTDVLLLLVKVAAYALTLTGVFYCQVASTSISEDCSTWLSAENFDDDGDSERRPSGGNSSVKPPTFQSGLLRANCIDCLDRTNVAQYAYGLAALGQQLHAVGVIEHPKVDLDDSVADDLMGFYEQMGDTLAHQYGGSAAHNKIFSERRGQWRAATQSREFFRTLQRFYSNMCIDAEKQDAINVFLGHFQPHEDPDKHYGAGRNGGEDERSVFKRSLSDGSILSNSCIPMPALIARQGKFSNQLGKGRKPLCESSPEISTSQSDATFLRDTPSVAQRQAFGDMKREHSVKCAEHGDSDSFSCSNFVDLHRPSSSANSCERSSIMRSLIVTDGVMGETTPSNRKGREQCESELSYSTVLEEFPDSFVQWVTSGQTLCH